MFFMFLLIYMSNFVLIRYYLQFKPKTSFFYIIVHYKDLKFKHMINNLTSNY